MTLALLISIVGLILYLAVQKPEYVKVAEVGRLLFFTGLLVWLWHFDRVLIR